jgi:D-alanyl-lipoteichoic acid acyltransferase DltB (MBOAT superfamily)
MLFNSFPFLFVFLPIALAGYQIAGHLHRRGVVVWLALASLAFYGYWKPWFLFVLCGSIAMNYVAACLISRRIPNSADTRIWMWGAIFLNLAALCYFKYLFPLLEFLNGLVHSPHQWGRVMLPLGISFFTFTQIAYLVDLQQGAAEAQDFASYLLFVTFFPHLIAGPIIHHKSIMPQFKEKRVYRLNGDDLAVGFSWFIMGLFKKVMLADNFAAIANPVYRNPGAVSALEAWIAVLSYAFQLYFDFSGYSDMACGLARMFSIQFPLNFSSPYKSTSIIDFWNRWHITLTQYITSYVFSPLQIEIRALRRRRNLPVNRAAMESLPGFLQMFDVAHAVHRGNLAWCRVPVHRVRGASRGVYQHSARVAAAAQQTGRLAAAMDRAPGAGNLVGGTDVCRGQSGADILSLEQYRRCAAAARAHVFALRRIGRVERG